MRLMISMLILFLLAECVSGCRTANLHFAKGMGCWETTTTLPDSPFRTHSVGIKIYTKGGYFPRPPRQDQLALVERVRKSLPTLLPLIVQKLGEYDKTLKDKKTLRDQLFNPSICLFDSEDEPNNAWSFAVERPDTVGDPSVGDGLVYFVKFNEMEIVDVYAGD